MTSNNGFIGANTSTNQSQQGFVGGGNTAAATQNGTGMGGMGGGMGGMGGGMGGGMNGMGGGMNNMGGQGNMGNNAAQTTPVRIAMKIGFTPREAFQPEEVSSAIANRLETLLNLQSPARVEMIGRKVILRGEVASEHERRLAEQLARLEATVDQVENQLVVANRTTPGRAGYDGVADAGGA